MEEEEESRPTEEQFLAAAKEFYESEGETGFRLPSSQ